MKFYFHVMMRYVFRLQNDMLLFNFDILILADGCNIDQKFFGHKAAFFSILTNFTPFCRYHWAKSEYSQLGLSSEMPKNEKKNFYKF